ncbi:hypothetical protein XMIN_3582 [Xanthomonas citri pv. mangiferaeindicae LMG 941]|nr:hypothetical protein XMIN_3582 [Xanthomonas citri pv. mangiferaeindicae LMG 941]
MRRGAGRWVRSCGFERCSATAQAAIGACASVVDASVTGGRHVQLSMHRAQD